MILTRGGAPRPAAAVLLFSESSLGGGTMSGWTVGAVLEMGRVRPGDPDKRFFSSITEAIVTRRGLDMRALQNSVLIRA